MNIKERLEQAARGMTNEQLDNAIREARERRRKRGESKVIRSQRSVKQSKSVEQIAAELFGDLEDIEDDDQ